MQKRIGHVCTADVGPGTGSLNLTRQYYLNDHLGNIRKSINETGMVVGYDDYYPFGQQLDGKCMNSSEPNAVFKFLGKERDAETNYDDFGARRYAGPPWRDARIARLPGRQVNWLQVDPLAQKYPGWSTYNYCADNPIKYVDPNGMDWILSTGNRVYWYGGKSDDRSNLMRSFKATSGMNLAQLIDGSYLNMQIAKYQNIRDYGPTPEGKYRINLVPSPDRLAEINLSNGSLKPSSVGGIEKIPGIVPNPNRPGFGYNNQSSWGEKRAKLEPMAGNDLEGRENSFYFHDSHKGYTHGCTEVEKAFFEALINYRDSGNKSIDVLVDYPNSEHNTKGGTKDDQK